MGRFNMGVPVLENGALARWALPQELGLDFLSCDPVPFFGNHVVILSRLGRYQSTLGLPFDFMNERFQGWGEWHIRETTDFKLECATIISNQGRCFIADQPWPDGTLEPAVYARVKETYDFVKAREDVYREAEVLSRIGILAAETTNTMLTEKWLSRLRTGSRNLLILPAPARTDAVDGAYLVLVQGGLQFQIFSEANLTGALPRLRLLIVPEQVMMLDDTWVRIRSYVEQGGRLLITGQTGLLRYDGGKRTETHLETLLGVNLEGEYPAPLNYLQFPAGFRSQFHLPDLPIMLRGPMNRLGGAQGEVLASVLEPREEAWDADGKWRSYTVFGAMPPRDEPSGPAVVYRKIGKGEVLYATGNWFGTYYREGNPTVRKILAAFLSTLLPEEERLLVVRKPLQVEVNLMRNEKGYLVSLANSAIQKQSRQFVHAEELPAAQNIHVRLRIEDGVSQVKLLPEGTSLDFKHSSGQLTFAVPELWIHSAVQIMVKKEN